MKHEHAIVVQIYTYIGFSQFARKSKTRVTYIWIIYHFTSLLKINSIQTITFKILGKQTHSFCNIFKIKNEF